MNNVFRTQPMKVYQDVEVKSRQVIPLEIKSVQPGSDKIFIADIEWVAKNDVPVSLTKKESVYKKNSDGTYGLEKMNICLFNHSHSEDAYVDIYKIEEHYLNFETFAKQEDEEMKIDPMFFPDIKTGVTIPAQGTNDLRLGIGSHTNHHIIDFKYSYDSPSYPRTVVPTEVNEIGDTEWKIMFYNADPNTDVTISARSVLKPDQH